MIKAILDDARYSYRSLAHSRGFAVGMVLILTLGIGATTTIFTLVNGFFFRRPPRIVAPQELVRANRFADWTPSNLWTWPDFLFFREHARSAVDLVAYTNAGGNMNVGLGKDSVLASIAWVSSNYFDVLGVPTASGRSFHRSDDSEKTTARQPVVMISHGFWQRVFGGTAETVGRELRLNGYPLTIAGVVAEGFRGVNPLERSPDIWLPVVMKPVLNPLDTSDLERDTVWLSVIARLRPDVSLTAAQSQVNAVSAALAEEVAEWADEGHGVTLLPDYRYQPGLGDRLKKLFSLLAAVVALLLGIACANVALLLLARSSIRRKTIGVRLALGASRGQIVRQMLIESLLLASAGGTAGLLLAFVSTDLAAQALPYQVNTSFDPDLRVLAATCGTSLLSALFFGTVPALLVSRVPIVEVVKQDQQDHSHAWFREAIVVAQIALSVALTTGAALFVRSFTTAAAVDLGFESENRLAVSLNPAQHGYDKAGARSLLEQALARTVALPGVRRVSSTMIVPFRGMTVGSVGREGAEEKEQVSSRLNFVGPGYFKLMGIEVAAGRDFSRQDRAGAPLVAAVSLAAAEKLWPGGNALGQRLSVMGKSVTVVALVGDVRDHDLGRETGPYTYLPALQDGGEKFSLLLETAVAPRSVAPLVEETLRELAPQIALTRIDTLRELVDEQLGSQRVGAVLVTLFSTFALLLAMVGLFGVLSLLVFGRRRIIGVQMALGATASRVALGVVRRGVSMAVIGISCGVGVAWASAQLVESFLFEVQPRDPTSFLSVPVIVLLVVLLATCLPAWRAARVNPIDVLREE